MKYVIKKNSVTWTYKGEKVLVEACGTESIRVRAAFCNEIVDENYNLKSLESVTSEIKETEDTVSIFCGKLEARIQDYGRITFFYNGDKILREMWIDEKVGMPDFQKARNYKGISGKSFRIQAFFEPNMKEHIYGMGQETTGCFDLKGCTIDLCQKNTKCTIPFYISTLGYGFLWNNPSVGKAELVKNRFLWEAYMSTQLDYVVIGGGEPAQIMMNYTEMTGRVPDVPEWIFGLWQSKLRYKTQDEIVEIAKEYHKRNIPVPVIVLDYFHWKNQGDWKLDERYFPDPEKMVNDLKKEGTRLMVSVWPTVDRRSENYIKLEEMGGLLTTERGPNVMFVCRGPETYVDMTNPKAARFLAEKLKENYGKYGIKAFWLDEAEPEIYPYDYDNIRFYRGNGLEIANYYPYAYARGIQDYLIGKEQDSIILVRSAWIGTQKIKAVLWTGDVPSTFESFQKQIVEGLQIAMCGITLWTTDIGGFYGGDPKDEEFRELMIRWFQFGTFCPILRMHGYRKPYIKSGSIDDMTGECYSGGENELWSYGEKAYEIMKEYVIIREDMKGYLKTQLRKAQETGIPIMRPVVFDYPKDKNVYELCDEYLFGDKYLVAPVTEYKKRKREVYLPMGKWKECKYERIYEGQQRIEVEAALEYMPVFEKIS